MPYEQVGKNEPVCIANEVPFEIPDSWEWVRVKNICLDIFSGKSPKYEKVPTEYRIIGQAANQQNGIDYTNIKYTNLEFWQSMPEKYFLQKNDVLLNTLGNGTLGRSGIIKDIPYDLLTDGHLFVFRNLNEVISIYFYYYLQIKKEEIIKSANGSTNQTFLNLKNTLEWIIPIPPLNEQFRIIEKLEELQPFVESYTNSEEKLDNLNSSFPETLKKSILQQAVMGKLVPQDENDEPASVLLERIRAEKQRLITEGKIKKNKNESVIFRRDNSHYEKLNGIERCIDDEVPFEIPEDWEWCRLGSAVDKLTDGTHKTPKYQSSGIPFLSVKDISSGKISFDTCKYISLDEHKELYCRCDSQFGDMLLTKVGTTGIPVLVDSKIEFSLFVSVALIKFNHRYLYDKYFLYLLQSPLVQKQCIKNTKGVGNKNWVMRDIANTLLAIPPLAEQQRIVEKIEQLLAITDKL